MYEIVDLKVKIITKSQSKVSMQKIDTVDTIVADDTVTIKLMLWEQLIDSVHSRVSYHFNNLTICIFDDEKFVNSDEFTAVEPTDDITIHMESPEIKDKLLAGSCTAIYINRSASCIACNNIQPCL